MLKQAKIQRDAGPRSLGVGEGACARVVDHALAPSFEDRLGDRAGEVRVDGGGRRRDPELGECPSPDVARHLRAQP